MCTSDCVPNEQDPMEMPGKMMHHLVESCCSDYCAINLDTNCVLVELMVLTYT